MGSQLYTKFSALIKRWPKELIRASEKTLGDHVKKTVFQAYGSGKTLSVAEEAKLEPFYESCNRLISNTHKKKYERLYDSTSSEIERKIAKDTAINFDAFADYIEGDESRTAMEKPMKEPTKE